MLYVMLYVMLCDAWLNLLTCSDLYHDCVAFFLICVNIINGTSAYFFEIFRLCFLDHISQSNTCMLCYIYTMAGMRQVVRAHQAPPCNNDIYCEATVRNVYYILY